MIVLCKRCKHKDKCRHKSEEITECYYFEPEPDKMIQLLHSYPDVYEIGHKAVQDLLTDPVVCQEKIDGSQFSFGIMAGQIRCRSKGKEQNPDCHDNMFDKAVKTVESIKHLLIEGLTYRGEFLSKPKHNVRAYGRVPANHIILYDIDLGLQNYMPPQAVRDTAKMLGLECVPTFYEGMLQNINAVSQYLEKDSILGGCKIEGIVIKNYYKFGRDKKVLMGKLVTQEFKEKHAKEWKSRNPSGKDVIGLLGEEYRAEARWHKSIQHLRDNGQLTASPKDIGNLIKEINLDVIKECEDEIKAKLFEWAWPAISRKITAGFPEWYKQYLESENEVKESIK